MATNDEALAVQQAIRLSPQLDKESVDSGPNLLEDVSPPEGGGILTIRRVPRRVAVRLPEVGGQPFVESADLLFEMKRLAREIFTDSAAAALDCDPFPVLPGRRQALFFYLPATQEQHDDVVSELKESLRYDKVGGKNFYERHPDLALRFARYDVPHSPQADLWCVYLFAPSGQWEDLRAAIAKRSSPPSPNGQPDNALLPETVVIQAATHATGDRANGRQEQQVPAGRVPPATAPKRRSPRRDRPYIQPPPERV